MAEKKIRLFTVPNIITLANMACGIMAILYALNFGDLTAAFWFIAAAALLDFLDGFAARALKQYSEVGKQLDSLADVVSFGVAPSVILYSVYISSGGTFEWGISLFVLALFSALRLAKFNVDDSQTDSFKGLPTPACALFVAAGGYLFAAETFTIEPLYILLTALILCYLLVSPHRMLALKFHNFSWRDNASRYTFIALSITALAIFQIMAVPFIIVGYVLVSAGSNAVCIKR